MLPPADTFGLRIFLSYKFASIQAKSLTQSCVVTEPRRCTAEDDLNYVEESPVPP